MILLVGPCRVWLRLQGRRAGCVALCRSCGGRERRRHGWMGDTYNTLARGIVWLRGRRCVLRVTAQAVPVGTSSSFIAPDWLRGGKTYESDERSPRRKMPFTTDRLVLRLLSNSSHDRETPTKFGATMVLVQSMSRLASTWDALMGEARASERTNKLMRPASAPLNGKPQLQHAQIEAQPNGRVSLLFMTVLYYRRSV